MTANLPQIRTAPRLLRLLRLFAAGAGVACSGLLASPPALAQEPTGPAIEYKPEEVPPSSARTSALLAGGGVFVGSYAVAFGTSYLWSDAPTAEDLRLPVVGPWMALAGAKCGADEPDCQTVAVIFRSFLAALSGIGQAGGLLIMAEALFLPSAPDTAATLNPVVVGTPLDATLRSSFKLERPQGELATPPPVYASPLLSETGVGLSIGGAF